MNQKQIDTFFKRKLSSLERRAKWLQRDIEAYRMLWRKTSPSIHEGDEKIVQLEMFQ